MPRAMLSRVSTGCWKLKPTELWPARLYTSSAWVFLTAWKTLRKSVSAIDSTWIRPSMPSRLRFRNVDICASREVPTTSYPFDRRWRAR